jgi:hypothetical protein
MKAVLNQLLGKISKWEKVKILSQLVLLSLLAIAILLIFLSAESWLWRIILSVISAVVYFFLHILRAFILEEGIPEKTRIEWGQPKHIKWKSIEFDEFVGDDLFNLFQDSKYLLVKAQEPPFAQVSDYSYIVLPAAKAYEGVLKKILVNAGLVSEQTILEKPELSLNSYFNPVGNEGIFNSLKDKARDKAIPHIIYSTYQECRNQIFHHDSYRDSKITLEDADFYIRRIDDAISKAYKTFVNKNN